ncbi:MAG: ABC transporter permease [Roseburia sp.]|nr:ABC transporter permease [Roseburia sp.]
MFGHLFKYGFKSLLRTKEVVFWTWVFPIALCTFMYFAFSNLFETTEQFHAVPVAVVQEKEDPIMDTMLGAVSGEGEGQLLSIKKTSEEEAEKLLEKEEVQGIIFAGDEFSLKVNENGMEQTFLKMLLEQLMQYKQTITDVAEVHPEKIMQTVMALSSQQEYYDEVNSSGGNQDNVINYFYAIFAMTCLFASYAGCDKAQKIQANVSVLGQRRNIVPVHKMKNILVDFLACELLQYCIVCVLLVYMKLVLGLDLGDKIPAILLLLFVGTSYGIMFGIFVGSLPRAGEGMKIGILTGVNLLLCALSDLMASGIKDLIEHSVPVINDINPAALICDSFYALNIYDTYDRFAQNMLLLGIEAVVLAVISYLMVRRSRYASL